MGGWMHGTSSGRAKQEPSPGATWRGGPEPGSLPGDRGSAQGSRSRRVGTMPISIVVPQLGESVAEGTVAKWLKAEGERVRKEEPLVEIQTDKINVEIPSPAEGVLSKILVAEGTTVLVGTERATLAGAEEPAMAAASSAPAQASAPAASPASPPKPAPPGKPAAAAQPAPPPPPVAPPPPQQGGNGHGDGLALGEARNLSPAV